MEEKDVRMWASFCHLAALLGLIVPFGNFLGPLVIWLLKRNESPFIDEQGKESLNFQLTLVLAILVSTLLIFVLVGVFLIVLLSIYAIIIIIYAAVKANHGISFRYPYIFRFIK